MSLDISFGTLVDLGGPDGADWYEVFTANITHNLNRMWQLAGCYEVLYGSHEKTVVEITPAITVAVDYMLEHPDECRKLDASNGWGTYEHALPWLQKTLWACQRFPKATVRVCR